MGDAKVTGLVFDLPHAPWMDDILRFRKRYDPARVCFPIEVTVVGSSGLGWFSPSQSFAHLAQTVSAVAAAFARFACAFSRVECFPESRVYYLALRDESPFHAFQRLLAASGLRFEPTPFSYKPHCTIAELPPTSGAEDRAALTSFSVPTASFEVSSVSFYAVNESRDQCEHLGRIWLGA